MRKSKSLEPNVASRHTKDSDAYGKKYLKEEKQIRDKNTKT